MSCRCDALTLGDVATQLEVSASTVRRWADAGLIASVRTSGGHRRFPASEIERLRRRRSGVEPAAIRFVALPGGPLRSLAELVADNGEALAAATVKALYATSPGGWFASAAASRPIGAWTAAVAASARSGDYATALAATVELGRAAEAGGASLLERHLFVERFAAVASRAAVSSGATGPDVVGARRLFARLGHALLDGQSADAPSVAA